MIRFRNDEAAVIVAHAVRNRGAIKRPCLHYCWQRSFGISPGSVMLIFMKLGIMQLPASFVATRWSWRRPPYWRRDSPAEGRYRMCVNTELHSHCAALCSHRNDVSVTLTVSALACSRLCVCVSTQVIFQSVICEDLVSRRVAVWNNILTENVIKWHP